MIARSEVRLEGLKALRVPVFVNAPNGARRRTLGIVVSDGRSTRAVQAPLVAPH